MKNSHDFIFAAVNALPDPVYVFSENGDYIDVIGRSAGDGKNLIGRNIYEVIDKHLADRFIAIIRETITNDEPNIYEYDFDDQTCSIGAAEPGKIWFEARVAPFSFMDKRCVLWLTRDITEQKNIESKLKETSFSDPLTGVYSRSFFITELNSFYHRFLRTFRTYSVISVDMDGFREMMEVYGQKVCDSILVHIARVLQRVLRQSDVVARLGGDKFSVLLPDTDVKGAEILAERLRKVLESSDITTPSGKLKLTASFGCSQVSAQDEAYENSVSRAEIAVSMAKLAGKNTVRSIL
ncbi:sensor domain-containing diguanylate cyclase [Seleniivibrio sp.]|uniref:sensor domain-containing diguanylate cyclase n=1 Tax=Seleniivibrio sp. TaxID=2898801 RepID=UPI0025DF0D94|nr:sensor domain-containing diguanylate cyclase [Seleniivibrio sp.]MCD8554321.1 GGDEF domain-containing protein [Seleniivibrio sp.]